MLGIAFSILNTRSVLSGSLRLSLPSGGPSAALGGLMLSGVCNLCLAASLAELLPAYPTASGQYHWTAVVPPRRHARLLAWFAGWMASFGWIAVNASGSLVGSQLIFGIIASNNRHFHPTPALDFAGYLLFSLVAFGVNYRLHDLLPYLANVGLLWSLLGLMVIPLTLLSLADRPLADPAFVFGYFINKTGWPDSMAWLLGLLQFGMALNGYDAVSHLIEEVPQPSVHGPRIMILCVVLGIVTGFLFLTDLFFAMGGPGPIDAIIEPDSGPLWAIFYHATRSHACANALYIFPLGCLFFGIYIMTTSSRMLYAFARDGGLPASHQFAQVQPSGLPRNALILKTAVTALLGCIFLLSTTAFNAISTASVVALNISYALPILFNCCRGRTELPKKGFQLPPRIAWLVN